MSQDALIPPSPSEADYAGAQKAGQPVAMEAGADPIALFQDWFAEARKSETGEVNAVTLATVDAAGLPDGRMVLLKHVDGRGFVFYSHATSAKGRQLAANPKAALVFYWKSLGRQVRVRGDARAGLRRRGGRLFLHPRSTGADRGVGLGPVGGDGGLSQPRKAGGRDGFAIWRGANPPSPAMARFPPCPQPHRVLGARAAFPAASAAGVRARRRDVEDRETLSVVWVNFIQGQRRTLPARGRGLGIE